MVARIGSTLRIEKNSTLSIKHHSGKIKEYNNYLLILYAKPV
jgi:hypothetical protein